MRYDTPVYFQKTISGEYDPNTGNYGEDSVDETLRYASVMDTSIKTMRLIYGEIKNNLDMKAVKYAVKLNGSEMNKKAKRNAEKFKGHYEYVKGKGKQFVKPTGTLKRSIDLAIKDKGMTAEVEPHTLYGGYVELGTRKMQAQPYLKPAFDEQKVQFRKDMDKLTR